ncbi:hypothetical protein M0R04_10400 [Candidatus Dojkabacteria bacterium]|jgi:hypothetical protein|nr:hypothetical protein [Candidatus Dojkabacteria bacterium]
MNKHNYLYNLHREECFNKSCKKIWKQTGELDFYGNGLLEVKIPIFTGYKLTWKFPFIQKTYTLKSVWQIQRMLNKMRDLQLKKDKKK